MSGHPAADLAALDLLYKQRRILVDDHRAGVEFSLIARRCGRRHYLPLYIAAVDVLERSGGRRAVETVVVFNRMPASQTEFEKLEDGLDALAVHFRAEGLL
jgi:hypothetical protein